MPRYFPENNSPRPSDTEVKSLQKINDLLAGGMVVSIGEVQINNTTANPVPITGTINVGSTAVVSAFTSTTSDQIAASNPSRDLLTIFNEGAAQLFVLFGSGTASISNYTNKLFPGDFMEIERYTGQVNGIFLGPGTARVTVVS